VFGMQRVSRMGGAIGRGTVSLILVLVMAVGSVAMWIGVPVFWLWLGSQVANSSRPSLGLYAGILVGIVVTMAAVGKLLGVVNRFHMALTDRIPGRRQQTIWLKSMRGDATERREHGILATVMVVSVSIALALFGIWFFFLAEGGGI
jgi:hypothetical protein